MLTADQTFLMTLNKAKVHHPTDWSTMNKLPRVRNWNEFEEIAICAWRRDNIPLIAIATKLNRNLADVDCKLAEFGVAFIVGGATPMLVMEKLAFSALAYQKAKSRCKELRRRSFAQLADLADELKDTYAGTKCASGRPIVIVAHELRLIADQLEQSDQ